MRIAERIAFSDNCGALVTGESLGQVASQTMEALGVTGGVCSLPVLRPLIGMDKEDIVLISRKIDTYEISIRPYEDCCTVFTPKHPKTKPRPYDAESQEARLDVVALIEEALANTELLNIEREDLI
jgi:thiamine biosynthesis protein ThiI